MNYKNRLIPLPQNRVWRTYPGGRVLDKLVGKSDPCDSHFPEDWIASVTPARNPDSHSEHEGISKVQIDGQELLFTDLIASDPEYFLGKDHVARFGEQLMVLVKLLDSAVRLHFQTHPTAEFARAHLSSNSGKAEAYYILSVRDGIDEPYVYLGFQRPPSREELKRCIEEQDLVTLESFFDKIKVKPGDVLFIPGGVPHAIGEGIFMVEIMEPSDLAVRFEFEKAGYTLPESARFMNRGLEFCLDVFDFRPMPESMVREKFMFEPQLEVTYGETAHRYHLIGSETTSCYRIKKSVIKGAVMREESSFFTGVITAGSCVLRAEGGVIELKTFDKFFCPAGLDSYEIEADQEVQILECFPPV
ncbi:MAG: class I mannose-6-phosphate isomerase [Verrucomicrobia bacterium]|nr:class I mannose-6-phosphate isomerase [Verrucomicrobiota bacterium]MDA1068869.1 class I mannose-6-phosphate isomerase [Verrucomicrobiota bacterium]